MKNALVLGAGGFIGYHMVQRLVSEGFRVTGVDLKHPEFGGSSAHEFKIADLRDQRLIDDVIDRHYDHIYQFAADMGGAGYIFTGDSDASIMQNSAAINLNVLQAVGRQGCGRIFYASSACIYPKEAQESADNPDCSEKIAYPANPDSEYGWEKLFSERLYLANKKNFGIDVKIARYHNIFGEFGTWRGGKEKAPAAVCRKVAELAGDQREIEIWGDGKQTRSFLYIDECIEGTFRLMSSSLMGPYNIGSSEMISINELALMVGRIAGKDILIKNVPGPQGVRGRKSENSKIKSELHWSPTQSLEVGIEKTFKWIDERVKDRPKKEKL